jgi:hypothetical protein
MESHWILVTDILFDQLTRDDPSQNKTLNRAALGLTVYGAFIFVFWYDCLVVFYRVYTDVYG